MTTTLISQTLTINQQLQNNLQMYSNYRQNLRNHFVYVSANNEMGSNIPASCIITIDTKDNEYGPRNVYFSDGNGTLPFYIGLLATEYKLLEMSGQDFATTKNELTYALNALDRLDDEAESYWRGYPKTDGSDRNGFYLRDDVTNSNFPLLPPGYTVRSLYKANLASLGNYFINSKDMDWNYLLNLSLVIACVDDQTIVNHAKDVAYRMVKHMWGCSDEGCDIATCWTIPNPVNNYFVPGAGDVDGGSAVATAADAYLGTNFLPIYSACEDAAVLLVTGTDFLRLEIG